MRDVPEKPFMAAALSAALLTVGGPASANELVWRETQKLLASDRAMVDTFGQSVAVWGDAALVGAYGDDVNGIVSGSAYVFRFDGVQWVEEQKLLASDRAAGDLFGYSVALSGDVALVGAYADDRFSGAAYVFRFDGARWVEEQKLLASDGAVMGRFGLSSALSGDVALVGSGSGSAYPFRFDGTRWVEEQKLSSGAGTYDGFGLSVAVSGDVAVVGAHAADGLSGAADVFRFDGVHWVEEQRLHPGDGTVMSRFGGSVAISGDLALVGAYADDENGIDAGSAYVFRFDGVRWVEEQKLLASDGAERERDLFGFSVAVSGDAALVGAIQRPLLSAGPGAAFVFRFDDGRWVEEQKLLASDGATGDAFGTSVALAGGVALIGSPADDSASGSAYVYELPRASVNLKVNGVDSLFVRTGRRVRLTLDMTAGSEPLDHYFFWWARGTYYWVTADGVSTTAAPLGTFTPVNLTEVPLYDFFLPRGLRSFGWLMMDGGTLVDADVVVVWVGRCRGPDPSCSVGTSGQIPLAPRRALGTGPTRRAEASSAQP